MQYRIMTVCFETYTNPLNTMCGQNAELLNDKPAGEVKDKVPPENRL
jgi:hypothetical protein